MPNVLQVPGFGFITGTLPDLPSSITVTSSASTTISGTYTAASAKGSTNYLGYQLGDGSGSETIVVVSGGTFSVTGLTRNTSYIFRMRSHTIWGYSDWSNFVSAFTTDIVSQFRTDQELFQDSAGTVPATVDGDPIGFWGDTGFDNANLSQSNNALRPTLKTNIQNSKSMIRFNGSSQYIRDIGGDFSQPCRYLVVLIPRAITGGTVIVDSGTTGTNRNKIEQLGGLIRINAGTPLTGSQMVIGTAYLIDAVFDGTESSIRSNNGPKTSGDAGVAGATGLTVGCNFSLASFSQVDIGEIVIYAPNASDSVVTTKRQEMATYWNLYDPSADSEIQPLLDATAVGGTCDLPAGRYPVGSYAWIKKAMTVNGHASGTTLLHSGSSSSGLLVKSYGEVEHHGTGTITAGQNQITVADPGSFAINDKIMIEFGVAYTDAHEPFDTQFFTVTNKVGSVLTVLPVFPRTVPTYSSTPPYTWSTFPERSGPWHQGSDSGQFWRGFGQDHSVYTFTTIAENVTVNNVHTALDSTHNPNTPAQASYHAMWANGVTLNGCVAEVMQSSFIHTKRSINVTMSDGWSVLDSISTVIWNVNAYASNIFSSAGCTNSIIGYGTASGDNIYLMNQEACCRGAVVGNSGGRIIIDSDMVSPAAALFQHGNFGQCDATITNVTFRGAQGDIDYDPTSAFPDYDVSGMRIEGAAGSDWTGSLRISQYASIDHLCGHNYGPSTVFQHTFTMPATVAGQFYLYSLPVGIFQSVKVRVSTIAGISSIQYPSVSVSPLASGSWMTITDFETTEGRTNDPYRCPYNTRILKFWGSATPTMATVDIEVTYFPEI